MARITAVVLGAACFSFTVSMGLAASPDSQWPQFRGPSGNGVAAQPHPSQWNANKNRAWSADIAGGGWSSPVAAGDRVFVTTAVSQEFSPKGFGEGVSSMRSFFNSKPPKEPISFEVHCLSLSDGKLLWKKEVASGKPAHKIHPSNSYATESPATDGKHIYAYFAAVGVVVCLDLDGELVWTRDLGAYRSKFKTKKDEWIEVHLPVEEFAATWFGRVIPNQALDPTEVTGLGILLGDKKAGPFKLEIDWIKAFRPSE
ncbi:MAG: CIA30 family protein [Planctomycetes bacterium]|nr:CIA30 family protein [Planctomycetota bacterium]